MATSDEPTSIPTPAVIVPENWRLPTPPVPAPMPAPRVPEIRFTQIAVSPGQGNRDCLYALASDSSIWRLAIQHDNELWVRLPSLPLGVAQADPPTPTAKPADDDAA